MAENDNQSQTEKDPKPEGLGKSKAMQTSVSPITGLRVADPDVFRQTAQSVSSLLQSTDFEAVRLASQRANENILAMGRVGLLDGGLRVDSYPTTLSLAPPAEMTQLSSRLSKIEQGLNELKAGRAKNEKVDEPLLDDLIETTASAKGQTDSMLMARLHLPPQWLTDQQLVPVTLLERLEEYRSDENLLLIFAGTFGGAILGVLGSWFIAEDLPFSRSSILFLILLVSATVLLGYGAYVLHQRSAALKQKMFAAPSVSDQTIPDETEGTSR